MAGVELLSPKAAVTLLCDLLSLVYTHISPTSQLKVPSNGLSKCLLSPQLCWAQSAWRQPHQQRVRAKYGPWLLQSSKEITLVTSLPENKCLDLFPAFVGNGSALVRLLQEENFRLEMINSYSEEELQSFLTQCDIPWEASDTKVTACLPTHHYLGMELFVTICPQFTLVMLDNKLLI